MKNRIFKFNSRNIIGVILGLTFFFSFLFHDLYIIPKKRSAFINSSLKNIVIDDGRSVYRKHIRRYITDNGITFYCDESKINIGDSVVKKTNETYIYIYEKKHGSFEYVDSFDTSPY